MLLFFLKFFEFCFIALQKGSLFYPKLKLLLFWHSRSCSGKSEAFWTSSRLRCSTSWWNKWRIWPSTQRRGSKESSTLCLRRPSMSQASPRLTPTCVAVWPRYVPSRNGHKFTSINQRKTKTWILTILNLQIVFCLFIIRFVFLCTSWLILSNFVLL